MRNKLQCYLGRVQKSCQNFLTYFRLLLPLNIRRGRAIYWNLKAGPLLDDTFFIFVLDDTNWVQSDFKLAPDTDWTFRQYFISFAHNLDFLESQACHTISLSMVLNINKFLSHFTTFLRMFVTPVNFPRTATGRNGLFGCDRCVFKTFETIDTIDFLFNIHLAWKGFDWSFPKSFPPSQDLLQRSPQKWDSAYIIIDILKPSYKLDFGMIWLEHLFSQLHLLDLLEEKQLIDWKLERKYLTYSWCE